MIGIRDMHDNARDTLASSRALFTSRHYDKAVYLCGYVPELLLKARIVTSYNWPGWPETDDEWKPYAALRLKTHDLDHLLIASGREPLIKSHYFVEWQQVVVWNPEFRYTRPGRVTKDGAHDVITATMRLMKVL